MLGATSGLKATAGTIRGDFSSSRQMNLVHASDGPDAAKREIELYFRADDKLSFEAPADATAFDAYVSDPANPVKIVIPVSSTLPPSHFTKRFSETT